MVARVIRQFLIVCAVLSATAAAGNAQERRALVVGVDAYQNVKPLQKAVGDAKAMQSTLQRLGFSVDLAVDPNRRAFNVAVSNFLNKLKPGDVALLHFSGHGVALDGDNFLLPADVPSPGAGDKELLKSESMSLTTLIERIRQSGARTQILIIDACRDNPYAQTGSRSYGTRGGLMAVPPPRGSGGIFVMYSAGFGQTAADRLSDSDPEPTSVYTRTLLEKITVEGKAITDLAREVREDVEALVAPIGQEQRPAYYDELSGPPFYFAPPRASASSGNPEQAQSLDLTYWNSIKDARVAVLYRDYLDKFGDKATFAAIARERLREIDGSATPPVAAATPAPREAAPANTAATNTAAPDTAMPNTANASLANMGAAGFKPSFDCGADNSRDERAICADVGLASRDRILSQIYYQVADMAPAERRVQLRNEQRGWLVQRRGCMTGPDVTGCIAHAYDMRIAELQRMAGVKPDPALASLQRSTGDAAPAASPPMSPPSFACQGKLSPIEQAICADGVLGAKDRALSDLYGRLSKLLTGGARQHLTDSQRAWIRMRNQCQGSDPGACIGRAYDQRIGELRSALAGR